MIDWPRQDYESMVKFFGPVGENQTKLQLPYAMRLTWDLNSMVNSITCHEKIAEPLKRIFNKTLLQYGGTARIRALRLDRFSGCLNVRKMRGGSSWSIHSWGAAVDLDDEDNQLRWGKDRALFAHEDYEAFWRIVESEGGVSLGRARNYDFMHFQFARL
jgi:hypothetical protein